MCSMRSARMRNPFSSRSPRTFPAMWRETASGLTIASVKSMESWAPFSFQLTAKEFPDDVTTREHSGNRTFGYNRELLHVLLHHHERGLLERHLLGYAEDGARHGILHQHGACGFRLTGARFCRRNLGQKRTHDVPL